MKALSAWWSQIVQCTIVIRGYIVLWKFCQSNIPDRLKQRLGHGWNILTFQMLFSKGIAHDFCSEKISSGSLCKRIRLYPVHCPWINFVNQQEETTMRMQHDLIKGRRYGFQNNMSSSRKASSSKGKCVWLCVIVCGSAWVRVCMCVWVCKRNHTKPLASFAKILTQLVTRLARIS